MDSGLYVFESRHGIARQELSDSGSTSVRFLPDASHDIVRKEPDRRRLNSTSPRCAGVVERILPRNVHESTLPNRHVAMKHFTIFRLALAAVLLSSHPSVGICEEERSQRAADSTAACRNCAVDDRVVYVLTSRVRGRWPKLGPLRHASIAICPKGVSPIVYENGVPVSNCAQCEVYGTQTMGRGFHREGKRFGVQATRVTGISAATVLQRIRAHGRLNIPLLNDCRHDAIAVTGLRGSLFRRKLAISLR